MIFTRKRSKKGLLRKPRGTDWIRIGRYASMGVAVASGVISGVRASRDGEKQPKDEGAEQRKPDESAKEEARQEEGEAQDQKGAAGQQNIKKQRLIVNESIDVGVPLKTAYNQWTQFMELPSIMHGIEKIEQQTDDKVRWSIKVGPVRRTWTAEITEQNPDERIVWRSVDGLPQRGAVTFSRLNGNLTRVQVEMEYLPHGLVERVGNIFGVPGRRTRGNLRLFKHYLELAGAETGAWRGEISKGEGRQGERQPAGQASDDQ